MQIFKQANYNFSTSAQPASSEMQVICMSRSGLATSYTKIKQKFWIKQKPCAKCKEYQHVISVFTTVYVAMLLLMAVAISPMLAAHENFAHKHTDNVPSHTHSLSSILGHSTTAVVLYLKPTFIILEALQHAKWLAPDICQNSLLRCRSPPCKLS